MVLRLIAAALIGIWIVLVLIGKSGFVHVLLLTGLGVAFVEGLSVLRARTPADEG
jgi:hypothetical protein